MKRITRENINSPFTLHDRNANGFEIINNDLIMKTQSGILETIHPHRLLDGYIEFQKVQLDFSYVYLLGVTGNVGSFSGTKMFLKDFIEKYEQFSFCVMDETYGYNLTKYNGFLTSNHQHFECIIEIYHEGDMVFVVEE